MAKESINKVTNDSASGYCKYPDGTLMQWGSVGSYTSGQSTTYTINLPVSFNGTGYYVVANGAYFSEAGSYEGSVCTIRNVSASQFELHVRNVVNNYTNAVRWIAIGRWK